MGKDLPISKDTVDAFERSESQLKKLLDDMKVLSAKKPDGPLNKFKIRHINQVIVACNGLLDSEYKPFIEFDKFDEDEIPTNSDVVIIMSQYMGMLDKFKSDHQRGTSLGKRWCIPESPSLNKDRSDYEEDWDDDEDDSDFDDDDEDDSDEDDDPPLR